MEENEEEEEEARLDLEQNVNTAYGEASSQAFTKMKRRKRVLALCASAIPDFSYFIDNRRAAVPSSYVHDLEQNKICIFTSVGMTRGQGIIRVVVVAAFF